MHESLDQLGRLHGNADGVSRAPHLPEPDGSTLMVEEGINSLVTQRKPEVWSAQEWVDAQEADEDLQPLRQALRNRTKPSFEVIRTYSNTAQIYFGLFVDLHLNDEGILCYHRVLDAHISVIRKRSVKMVPRVWWYDCILKIHLHGAHCGTTNTLERATRHLFFSGMSRVVDYVVKTCTICQAARPKQQDQRHTYQPVVAGFPFQRLSIDNLNQRKIIAENTSL